jgi:hypothetical protein
VQEPSTDLAQCFILIHNITPAFDPLVRPSERDPRPLRRPLAQLTQEEGKTGAQPPPRRSLDMFRNRLDQFIAPKATTVQRLPDRQANRSRLLGIQRRVKNTPRITPGGEPSLSATQSGPTCCVPERQLLRRMKVQSSTRCPSLHQRPPLPQRRPDIGLRNPVDTDSKLKFRRDLNLRVNSAKGPSNLNKPVSTSTIHKARTRQTTRPHLIPTNLTHPRRS